MESYDAKSIQVLGGLEGVRKRPSMYIGSTGIRGLHQLVFEVVDNSVDEAMAGFCTEVAVTVNSNGTVTVVDNGRGIPVDLVPKYNKSALEIVMTKLHAGGKFDKKTYRVSGGLHGVGVSVVNALSEELTAEVKRDGRVYAQKYKKGEPVADVAVSGDGSGTGTKITFLPDKEIFETTEFNFDFISTRMRELAFLNKGLKITIKDEKTGKENSYCYTGGVKSFVEYMNKNRAPIHEPIYAEKEKSGIKLEFAIQYNEGYLESVFSFANNINTIEGGTHLSGFKTALTRALNSYAEKYKGSENIKLTSEDIREGLTAIISVMVPEPQFEGQTKAKLGNSEIKGIVDSIVFSVLTSFFEENPKISKAIIEKSINAAKAREAARKAREMVRKKNGFSSSLPGKLADCSSKDPNVCEVYIVEGDSAGGCFSGDTKVALTDGRNINFEELVEEDKQGKKNYCYTIQKDGTIGIGLIKHPRKTRKNAEVIKLILDYGEEIICTPDHKFMLRDGNYIRADRLRKEDSLMPLRRKLSKMGGRITIQDYEMVYDQKKHWIFTHLLADRHNIENGIYTLAEGEHKHHADFNKLNNNPENIVRMCKEEHLKLHSKILEKTIHKEEVKQKAREAHKKVEYRRKISEMMSAPEMKKMLSERAKNQWEDGEYRSYMAKKYKEFYKNNENYRKNLQKILNEAQKEYWSNKENKEKQSERVKRYFEAHPEAKEELRQLAKNQWEDPKLKKWRSNKTKEQWSDEFRKNRKKAYDRTYFNHTIKFMKRMLETKGNLEQYDEERVKSKNRNLLKKTTFMDRFFDNNEIAMVEAIENYNHKIKEIIQLDQKMDVYDLEVEGTHNFALASGVFVHNSAKQGRNREYQAILPLRGKILNVEKARWNKIFSSEQITTLVSALGTGIGEEFDINRLRYKKTIIMTDADVDGAHIRTLLLTFFFRYMRPLIDSGYIYIAQPPLYRIARGKQVQYAYNDEKLEESIKNMGKEGITIQRFKGLGEMNAEQLWSTTMDPENRILLKVDVEDAIAADKIFTILMGKDVAPRRRFIERHALEVKNLDI